VFPISPSQITRGNTQLLSDIAARNEETGHLWFFSLTFSSNFGLIANADRGKVGRKINRSRYSLLPASKNLTADY
jgi:hypothetical protein